MAAILTLTLVPSQTMVESYQPVQLSGVLSNTGDTDVTISSVFIKLGAGQIVGSPVSFPAGTTCAATSGTCAFQVECRPNSSNLNANGTAALLPLSCVVTTSDGQNTVPSVAANILVLSSTLFVPPVPGGLQFSAITQTNLIAAL